jgi:2-C-methyl-D-erythritol 4-phosphate cytidylyltransferase
MVWAACQRFAAFSQIVRIVVTLPAAQLSLFQSQLPVYANGLPVEAVAGGQTRAQSVKNAVSRLTDCDWILIHDAARPNVSGELIARVLEGGTRYLAVIPGIPVTDTLKRVSGDQVVSTVSREDLVAVQTPQLFHRTVLADAYDKIAIDDTVTDEGALVEKAGYPIFVVPGDPANLKITTPSDLDYLRFLQT